MLNFILSYIKSLFIPTDISLTLNGSKIIFTKEGDILLFASRNLNIRGKYIFNNCSDQDIKDILFRDDNLIQINTTFSSAYNLDNVFINKEEVCLGQLEEEIL